MGGCRLSFDIEIAFSILSSGSSIAGGGKEGSAVESGRDLGSGSSGVIGSLDSLFDVDGWRLRYELRLVIVGLCHSELMPVSDDA